MNITGDKLSFISEKYEAALSANAETIQRFVKNFSQYNGSRDIDGSFVQAKVVRNVTRELVESQINSQIPKAKVSSQCVDDIHVRNARSIERMCDYYVKKLSFNVLNDIDERQTYIFGGSVWLPEFDGGVVEGNRVGDIDVRTNHPKFFTPQPGIARVDDMDYCFIDIPLPREEIERRYGVTLDDGEGEIPMSDEDYNAGEESAGDIVLLHVCFYKDEKRNICEYIWTDNLEILDIDDYYARKARYCETCGRRAELCEADPCDAPEYVDREENEEVIYEDIYDNKGNVLIPAMSPLFINGVPQFEERQEAMLSHVGIVIERVNKSEVQIICGGIASRFMCFPASSDAARSFTGNILFFDEFAFAKNAAPLWTGAQATINRPGGGKVIILSTMLRGTKYEEIWNDEGNGFNRIFLGCFSDPRRTWEWYKETERVQGKKIKQEYPRTAAEALANLEGIFFEEFDVERHVCRPFEIPKGWKIYSAMDYGLDMFAHYKIAVDEEGICYVFHEIYKSNLTVVDAASYIHLSDSREGEPWHIPSERLAPPDLFRVTAENGKSQAQKYAEEGVRLIKVSNDRETGWISIKELIRADKLKIFSTCPNLIRTLSQICIDEKHPCDCKKEPHELTHAPDALRYFAIWWVKKPENEEKEEKKERFWSKSMYENYKAGDAEVRSLIIKKYGYPSNYTI